MNTAYEIEYNALKGTVEEISNRVDDLVEKVSSFGGNRPGDLFLQNWNQKR